MHIAFVTETFPPELNGVALTVAAMVNGLKSRGHTIDLVRPRQPHEDRRDDDSELRVPGIPLPMYRDLRVGLPLISRLINRWSSAPPALVHVATEGPLGWAAVRAARTLQLGVTSDFRTNFDQYSAHYGLGWFRPLVTAYLRRFHNATDRTFVPTPAMRDQLQNLGYQRLEVVGRGVDSARFSPAHRSVTLRASWGVGDATPVILYVGRLASEKNVPLAFRAFEAVRARVPSAKMIVVGEGPLSDRLHREYPDVIFAGRQSGAALATYYASADLFLFPSETDTFGNVTLEALASGLLVVAFRSGAAAAHVRDCVSGALVDPGDEQGFVASACALAQQARRLDPMRQAARRAGEAAAWDAVINRFEYLLFETADATEAPLARSCPA